MICILAGNFIEAERYASSQNLDTSEWFYPTDINDLLKRKNFHVLVIGTAGQNVPQSYFERIYAVAKKMGRDGRK